MKKTIKDFDLNNKKVIIRVDFNVPIKDGIIKDDNRIVESLETINYALSHNAKVILLSHLGRIKEESDKSKNNLEVVAKRLSELLHKDAFHLYLCTNKTNFLILRQFPYFRCRSLFRLKQQYFLRHLCLPPLRIIFQLL